MPPRGPPHPHKKKKKGRAPAHQNSFAFTHNPKSKTTQRILESANCWTCRRCHDKIEWRKQYRKYKPLTQPTKCNLCGNKTVRRAYHTICEPCTRQSDKARRVLDEYQQQQQSKSRRPPSSSQDETASAEDPVESEQPSASKPNEPLEVESPSLHPFPTRVCAICVQEPALPDEDDEQDDGPSTTNNGVRLTLRQQKTLERQRQRAGKSRTKVNGSPTNRHVEEIAADAEKDNEAASETSNSRIDVDDDEEAVSSDDPFLQAVGGEDELLTGQAYRERLLLQQKQQTE